MIPYIIARLALDTGDHSHKRPFALDVLYELLEDASRARKLYERYGFGYKEFIELTGQASPPSTMAPQAKTSKWTSWWRRRG